MSAPEFSPEEQDIVARFDAAPTPPETWDQELWDAIAALVPCHPEGDCEYSDECECTANDVRDLMYRLAVAERYRQQADDPDDPEVNRVCCSMLVSNPFYRGTTTPADAALAVFRGQQDPAVQRTVRPLDEARSRLYAWLGDCTSQADGDEWTHDKLRPAIDQLLARVREVQP